MSKNNIKIGVQEIKNIIDSFAKRGIIFSNEAQFQFDLAWELREQNYGERILLEHLIPKDSNGKKRYIDIVIKNGDYCIPIELKYKTADKEIEYLLDNGEIIKTYNQGACDLGCYDFLKDLSRIEDVVSDKKNSLNYFKGPLGSLVENQFYSVCPQLNLPVPYQPGDVLLIDCRPYAPGAFYCLIKEVGDDCCGIQCEYVDEKGKLETGALKHGDYFFHHTEVYQYLSPLYRAKIVSKDKLNWDDYIRRKQKC